MYPHASCVSLSPQAGGALNKMNLAHLYHADTFLNALRQQTARELKESMDNLQLVTTWDTTYNPGHSLAATVEGLLVQGAAMDGRRLTALAADAPSAAPVPAVRFVWCPKSKPLPTAAYLPAPLYRGADRQKVLFEVQLPLAPGEPADAWVLAGVALFVSS